MIQVDLDFGKQSRKELVMAKGRKRKRTKVAPKFKPRAAPKVGRDRSPKKK
jgi:hypothetical protein